MKTSLSVRRIAAAESRELRRSVLRPSMPSGSEQPGEDRPGVVHLGAYDGQALLSACVIFPEPCPWLPGEHAWRLRGMATDPQRRGSGAGTAILHEARRIALADGATVLWCLARETAVGFYLRHGWAMFSTVFDTDLGPHQRMWLRLGHPPESAPEPARDPAP
ncbi:MAG TPA: GNAT family N-acetyltransferase [Jatrophihabitans sp.]|nr:GNAT family N-acetyltransferase [Jatrophihabitans sp.]